MFLIVFHFLYSFKKEYINKSIWNAGMNDLAVTSLAMLLKSAPSVKTLFLEANPIRDTEPFHMFITEDNS